MATARAFTVMPRSRSISRSSSTCSRNSRCEMAPLISRSWSASVLFPWSMWATIEKLRMNRESMVSLSFSVLRPVCRFGLTNLVTADAAGPPVSCDRQVIEWSARPDHLVRRSLICGNRGQSPEPPGAPADQNSFGSWRTPWAMAACRGSKRENNIAWPPTGRVGNAVRPGRRSRLTNCSGCGCVDESRAVGWGKMLRPDSPRKRIASGRPTDRPPESRVQGQNR